MSEIINHVNVINFPCHKRILALLSSVNIQRQAFVYVTGEIEQN